MAKISSFFSDEIGLSHLRFITSKKYQNHAAWNRNLSDRTTFKKIEVKSQPSCSYSGQSNVQLGYLKMPNHENPTHSERTQNNVQKNLGNIYHQNGGRWRWQRLGYNIGLILFLHSDAEITKVSSPPERDKTFIGRFVGLA